MSSQIVTPIRRTGEAQDERAIARLDVAPFVEDVVGREQALVVDGDDPARASGDRGVEDPAAPARRVLLKRAVEPQRAAARPGDSRRGALGLGDEGPPLHEVPRRVTADGELRKEHQVGALALRAPPELQDLLRVSGEVPDCRVDLRDGDLQCSQGSRVAELESDVGRVSSVSKTLNSRLSTLDFPKPEAFRKAGRPGSERRDPVGSRAGGLRESRASTPCRASAWRTASWSEERILSGRGQSGPSGPFQRSSRRGSSGTTVEKKER